jgi:diketogulonate reductase-like aldo/keto reductase
MIETKKVTLNNGIEMPTVGLGTFDGFMHTEEALQAFRDSITYALQVGYRAIDCADVYNNEQAIGEGLHKFLAENPSVKREDIFITSKVNNCDHARENLRLAVGRSLSKLRIDYLDLYLIHWPIATKKGEDGKDVLVDIPLIETWRALEELVDEGKIRSIGVSNFSIRHLEEILSQCRIKPVTNQIECNPLLNNEKVVQFCMKNGIVVTAYSPLGKAGSKYQFKSDLLNHPDLVRIAEKYKRSPAQVALKWQLQRGIIVIPKSVTPERIKSNIELSGWELEKEDYEAIFNMHTGYRMVKPPFVEFYD